MIRVFIASIAMAWVSFLLAMMYGATHGFMIMTWLFVILSVIALNKSWWRGTP